MSSDTTDARTCVLVLWLRALPLPLQLVSCQLPFHGRGFFPENLSFESWMTRLAALEAIIGLLIEISFIATFTQRFFGSK